MLFLLVLLFKIDRQYRRCSPASNLSGTAVGTNDGSRRSCAINSSSIMVGTDGGSHPSGQRPRPKEYAYDASGMETENNFSELRAQLTTLSDTTQDFYKARK